MSSAFGFHPRADADSDADVADTDAFRSFTHTHNPTPHPTWAFDSASYLDEEAADPPVNPSYDEAYDNTNWLDAFRASPSPPAPSFLDHILNPVESNSFGYTFGGASNMSSSQRQGRLSNGYVDLTNDSPDVAPSSRRPKRESPTPGPSTKRLKRNDGTAAEKSALEATVEEIDLSDDNKTVQDVLQKQREEAVKAQSKAQAEEKPTTFNTFNCVICMDTPTDLTATACGHLFCHTCLMEALIAGENRGGPGEQRRSQCPVCRKNINRSKASDIIPLLLKKGLATQPRKTRPVATNTTTATAAKVKL